jgi:hypothetical protein
MEPDPEPDPDNVRSPALPCSVRSLMVRPPTKLAGAALSDCRSMAGKSLG